MAALNKLIGDYTMSEVPEEESQSKEAVVLTEDQEKNKHILLALLEDKGIDIEGGFGIGSFMSMIKVMYDPEFMTEVFKTIGDMSGGDGAEGIKSIAGLFGVVDVKADVDEKTPSPEVGEIQELRAKLAEIEATPEDESVVVGQEFMDSLTDKQKIYMAGMMVENVIAGTPMSRLVDDHKELVASGKDVSEMLNGLDEESPMHSLLEEAGADTEKFKQLLLDNAEQIENETGLYMGSELGIVTMEITVEGAPVNEEKPAQDLGGVDGTASTYITPDKPADVKIEGTSVIKDAMEDGSTVVAGSFNNNVTAESVKVNSTVDQDVVASAGVSAPLDLAATKESFLQLGQP